MKGLPELLGTNRLRHVQRCGAHAERLQQVPDLRHVLACDDASLSGKLARGQDAPAASAGALSGVDPC